MYILETFELHLIFRWLRFFSLRCIILRCTLIFQRLVSRGGILKGNLSQRELLCRILRHTGRLVPLNVPIYSAEARSQVGHLSQGKGYFGTSFHRILGFFQLEGGYLSSDFREFCVFLYSGLSFKLWMLTYSSDFPVNK